MRRKDEKKALRVEELEPRVAPMTIPTAPQQAGEPSDDGGGGMGTDEARGRRRPENNPGGRRFVRKPSL